MMSPSRREVNLNLAKRHVRLAREKAAPQRAFSSQRGTFTRLCVP